MADSQSEFVRLFSQHASQLFGFVLVLTGNRSDAEDIVQNASVVLWEKFDAYQPGTSFQPGRGKLRIWRRWLPAGSRPGCGSCRTTPGRR
jgi:hypothetical protein